MKTKKLLFILTSMILLGWGVVLFVSIIFPGPVPIKPINFAFYFLLWGIPILIKRSEKKNACRVLNKNLGTQMDVSEFQIMLQAIREFMNSKKIYYVIECPKRDGEMYIEVYVDNKNADIVPDFYKSLRDFGIGVWEEK